MTITLESIKAEQTKLAAMIDAFEQQQQEDTVFYFPEATINMQQGEHYAGLVVGKDGDPSYHLILLPGEAESVKWDDAMTWAKAAGGDLPSRREQALLFCNLKEQFQSAWYWSNEQNASDASYAWCQGFDDGSQDYDHKTNELRARAVRRLIIE